MHFFPRVVPSRLVYLIPETPTGLLNYKVGPPRVHRLADPIGKHLLYKGVGEHLQPIGIVEPLLNIQIAALGVLHIHMRSKIHLASDYLIQLAFLEILHDSFSNFIDLLSGLRIIQRESLLGLGMGVVVAAREGAAQRRDTVGSFGEADGIVF